MKRFFAVLAVSLTLCLVLLGGSQPLLAAGGTTLSDVAGHWAQAEIEAAVQLGIVNGYPDGTFQPDRQVSRAEIVKMAVVAAYLSPSTGTQPLGFHDVADHWVAKLGYLQTAEGNGLVPADLYGAFVPDHPASRQEVALIVRNALHRFAVTVDTATAVPYSDTSALSDGVKTAIAEVSAAGIFKGYPDGSFGPDRPITRAEAAAIVNRLRQRLPKLEVPAKLVLRTSGGTQAGQVMTVTVEVQDAQGERTKDLGHNYPNPITLHVLAPDGQPVGWINPSTDQSEWLLSQGRSTFMFMVDQPGVYTLWADGSLYTTLPGGGGYTQSDGTAPMQSVASDHVQVQVGAVTLSKDDPAYAWVMPQPPTVDGKQRVVVDLLDRNMQRVALTQDTLPSSFTLSASEHGWVRTVQVDAQVVPQGDAANPAAIKDGQIIFVVSLPPASKSLDYQVDATINGHHLSYLTVN